MVRIKWIALTVKYQAYCMVCGELIHVGGKAQWFKGIGVRHASCGKKADQVEELKEKSFEALIQGNLDGARESAQKALDAQPDEKELFVMAQSLYDKWDFEGAVTLYGRILKKNPKHMGTLMSKASALRYLRKARGRRIIAGALRSRG